MEVHIWDKQFKRWFVKSNVKYVFNDSDAFKVEFRNGTWHEYNQKLYDLDFLFSDDWYRAFEKRPLLKKEVV